MDRSGHRHREPQSLCGSACNIPESIHSPLSAPPEAQLPFITSCSLHSLSRLPLSHPLHTAARGICKHKDLPALSLFKALPTTQGYPLSQHRPTSLTSPPPIRVLQCPPTGLPVAGNSCHCVLVQIHFCLIWQLPQPQPRPIHPSTCFVFSTGPSSLWN